MTAAQMLPAIGATVEVATGIDGLTVTCMVRDAKTAWGSVRLLVAPVSGTGSAWVDITRLRKGGAACVAIS